MYNKSFITLFTSLQNLTILAAAGMQQKEFHPGTETGTKMFLATKYMKTRKLLHSEIPGCTVLH